MDNTEYKKLLRKYKLTDKAIGELFGYSSPTSWNGSHRRPKVIAGIVGLVNRIESIVNKENKNRQ